MNPNEKVGVVLSGGGAAAAYEVGVLKAIYGGKCRSATENPVEVLCGSGAGGFNAAVLASRLPGQYPAPLEYLESLWADEIPREGLSRNNRAFRKRLDTAQFFDLGYMWRRPLKAFWQYGKDIGVLLSAGSRGPEIWNDSSPMLRLITESVSLESIRDGELARPYRSLRVVATECGSRKAQVFGNADFTEEDGYSIVFASCSLPGVFLPVEMRGKEYVYGGVVMPAPLAPALEAGCTVVHMVHVVPKDGGDDMGDAAVRAALAADGRRVAVHQYRPKVPVGSAKGRLDFTREQVEKAIAAGESDALAHDCAESGCIL